MELKTPGSYSQKNKITEIYHLLNFLPIFFYSCCTLMSAILIPFDDKD